MDLLKEQQIQQLNASLLSIQKTPAKQGRLSCSQGRVTTQGMGSRIYKAAERRVPLTKSSAAFLEEA